MASNGCETWRSLHFKPQSGSVRHCENVIDILFPPVNLNTLRTCMVFVCICVCTEVRMFVSTHVCTKHVASILMYVLNIRTYSLYVCMYACVYVQYVWT